MEKLWIYGTGGHATVVVDMILSLREYEIIGFIDDDQNKAGSYFYKHANVFTVNDFEKANKKFKVNNMFISIGDNSTRKRIAEKYAEFNFPVFIHPTAILGKYSNIREGSAVMPYAIIESEAKVGRHNIINNASIIGHGSNLGDYCHVGGGVVLSGGVTLGDCCLVGVGACVTPTVKVGNSCKIGSGSVITKNIPDNVFMFGNPARQIGKYLKM